MGRPTVEIEVWSDYVCPFCYLAEPTLAQVERELAAEARIFWRAFELRPDPVPTLDPGGDYLRNTWERAVYPLAEARGMVLHLPPVQPRSRLAHEAAAYAREAGRFSDLNHALFRAFFEHGQDIGRLDILLRVATSAGLDAELLSAALTSGRYRGQVLADETKAHQLGLSGVPATLVSSPADPGGQPVLVEGAQPIEAFRQAVTRVRDRAEANGRKLGLDHR